MPAGLGGHTSHSPGGGRRGGRQAGRRAGRRTAPPSPRLPGPWPSDQFTGKCSISGAPLPALCPGLQAGLREAGALVAHPFPLNCYPRGPLLATHFSMSLFLQVFCMASCLLLSPLLVDGISVGIEATQTLVCLGSRGEGLGPSHHHSNVPSVPLLLTAVRTYRHWPI